MFTTNPDGEVQLFNGLFGRSGTRHWGYMCVRRHAPWFCVELAELADGHLSRTVIVADASLVEQLTNLDDCTVEAVSVMLPDYCTGEAHWSLHLLDAMWSGLDHDGVRCEVYVTRSGHRLSSTGENLHENHMTGCRLIYSVDR